MKLNKNYIQTFAFVLVYLFAIYFWSQPYQERKLPYGEYDAMSHFEVGDYIAHNDKSMFYLPPYIDLRYGADNKFKPHTLWYAPPFHTALGISEVIGGERVVPIFLLNTFMATFIIITLYFVINSLFGFTPAILSALLIIFSPRDFMPYLWGQWPERFAYAFAPIILYCFYKYFENSKFSKYLYLTALFLGISLLIHPLVFFHSALGIIALYIILSIKQKKFVFKWKRAALASVIFLAIFMLFPYQTFNIFPQIAATTSAQGQQGNGNNSFVGSIDFTRLFHWSLNPKEYAGSVPENYFSFREMHGLWTLPFLLLGMLFLLIRREDRDLFLLAWLISLYFVLHRDIIGKASFLHRSLSASAHIFAPLTALGAIYIASFIASFVKLQSNFNRCLKYSLIAFFVYLALSVNMAYASKIINKNNYNPAINGGFFVALNNDEYTAAQWILENVPEKYNTTLIGIPHNEPLLSATSKKIRWFAAVSQHVTRFYYLREDQEQLLKSKDWYFIMDYTMLGKLNDRDIFNKMQEFEKTKLSNHTLIYDKNNIRVFKPEAKKGSAENESK